MVHLATLVYGFLASSIVLLLVKMFDKKPAPIFGIYQRRSGVYWIKVIFMYVILLVKKINQKLYPNKDHYIQLDVQKLPNSPKIRQKLFPLGPEYYKKLDIVQKLAPTPKAVDAVYFNGANKNGDYLNLGTARRINRLVDGFLYLKIHSSEFGLLEFPKLPDTSLFNTGKEESYEAEGIQVIPIEPTRKWRILFNGQLREADNQNLHDVSIDALYTSDEPWFNYETDMDAWNMAKVLAYEKWSRSYFKNVKQGHQLHYEQFGIIKARITVDNHERNIEIDAVRDHSIAVHRDWASFRRYIIHWVTTENGDHFSIGSVCQPVCYSRMQIGYMYNAHDRKMYPITSSGLDLYQYGELGNPPRDYAFTFKAGKTNYAMQVNISDAPYFYISKEWESKVYECLCTVVVNGVKGYGGVEWEYRNVEGRNIAKNKNFE